MSTGHGSAITASGRCRGGLIGSMMDRSLDPRAGGRAGEAIERFAVRAGRALAGRHGPPRVGVSPAMAYSAVCLTPRLTTALLSLHPSSVRRRSPTMNGMHDTHKRTSISQLLNPSSDSSAYSHAPHLPSLAAAPGVPTYQHPQHPHHPHYPPHPDSASSFHLRAANWGPANDDQSGARRRPDAPPAPPRPYPMHPHMYPELNGDMQSRQPRPRIDEHTPYAMAPSPWPHSQPDMSHVHYASPVLAPMYSEERTGNAICPLSLTPSSDTQVVAHSNTE